MLFNLRVLITVMLFNLRVLITVMLFKKDNILKKCEKLLL